MRKLLAAIVLVGAFLPVSAWALGLGTIHLRSNLNQSLNAEIDLLSADPKALDEIRITLASPQAFKKAHVERLFILSRLKFKTITGKNGKTVVLVTTKELIREPFLNFLIEINWPKGRMLREYTLLLDPPVALKKKSRPALQVARTRKLQRNRIDRNKKPRRPRRQPVAVAGVSVDGGGSYHTDRRDTLWGIANKLKPQDGSSTTYQMMMALQRVNPGAFQDGNVNNLKKGSILRMPNRDELKALTHQEALDAYQDQVGQSRSQKQQVAKQVDVQPEIQSEPALEVEDEPKPETTRDASELKLVTPTAASDRGNANDALPGESSPDDAELGIARNEFVVAREQLATQRQENTTVRTQNEELERQLESMKRLLSLKDEQLAALQAAKVKDPANVGIPDYNADTQQISEQAEPDLQVDGQSEIPEPSEDALANDETAVAMDDASWDDEGKDTWKDDEKSGDIVTTVMRLAKENMLYIGVGIGFIVVLFVVVFVVRRRRNAEDDEYEDEDEDEDEVMDDSDFDDNSLSQTMVTSPAELEDDSLDIDLPDLADDDEDSETELGDPGGTLYKMDVEESVDPVSMDDIDDLEQELTALSDESTGGAAELDLDLDLDGLADDIDDSDVGTTAALAVDDLATEYEEDMEIDEDLSFDLSSTVEDDKTLMPGYGELDDIELPDLDSPDASDDNGLEYDAGDLADASAKFGSGIDESTQLDLDDVTQLDESDNLLSESAFEDGGDEVDTKLDLAKAYIDMGDPAGALDILEEVAAEGNAKQKAEAQTLIASVSKQTS